MKGHKMRKIIPLILCLAILGCGKEKIYYKKSFSSYDIISYEDISVEQEDIARKMFLNAMKFLNQDKLKSKFKIKIVYNRQAFETCWLKTSEKKMDYNTDAYYHPGSNEVVIPRYNFDKSSVGHEMIHAIADINNLELSDTESLAYLFSDKYVNMQQFFQGNDGIKFTFQGEEIE